MHASICLCFNWQVYIHDCIQINWMVKFITFYVIESGICSMCVYFRISDSDIAFYLFYFPYI